MDVGDQIGQRLRAMRIAAGLSQEQLAVRLGTDVAAGTVSRWERGTRVPTVATLVRIAEALGADAEALFRGLFAASSDGAADADLILVAARLRGLSPAQRANALALIEVYCEGVEIARRTE